MRLLNGGWILLSAGAAIAACSAEAGSGNGGFEADAGEDASAAHDASADAKHDGSNADAATQDVTQMDASVDASSDASDGAADASSDAPADAAVDAPVDAGHDAAIVPPGTACSQIGATESQPCGLCGTQTSTCAAPDGGQPVWQPWGTCTNEVVGGCTPGTQTSDPCGLCGTRAKQCQPDCTWAVGACLGQPMNACMPGVSEYVPGAPCDAGGREHTCQQNCTWGSFGSCIVFDGGSVNALTIPLSVGAPSTSKVITLKAPGIARIDPVGSTNGSCVVDTQTTTVDEYLEIFNPTNLTATVTVWLSGATSGTFDTLAAVYAGAMNPPANRQMCVKYNDDCSTSPCVGSLMSGFVAGTPDNRPVIGPGQSVMLYVGAYSSTTMSRDVQVNARTDVLQ